MNCLLSIDPGVSSGFALWKNRQLVRAWSMKFEDFDSTSEVGHVDEIICESPQVYLANLKAKGSQIRLALTAGELVGRIGAVKTTYCHPKKWKGNTPKEICHRRVYEALSFFESNRIERPRSKKALSDVLDAVGIGLFHLGRVQRGCIVKKGKAA